MKLVDPDGKAAVKVIITAYRLIKKAYKIYKKTGKLSPANLKKAGISELVDIADDLSTIFSGTSSTMDKISAGADLLHGTDFNSKSSKTIRKGGDEVENVLEKSVSSSSQKKPLHRPYIRKSTKEGVEELPKGLDGRYIDPRDMKPFDGKPDFGNKPGHEYRKEKTKAEQEGLTQPQFNDRMNNSKLYQWENPHLNRGHKYEQKD